MLEPNTTRWQLYEPTVRRVLLLAVLFCIPIKQALVAIDDTDLFWHLASGRWIVAHHAVPTTDPFSFYGQGQRWFAYSWLFELVLFGLYSLWSWAGAVTYTLLTTLAIVWSLYTLVRRLQGDFLITALLTGAGLIAILPIISTRPWMLTILFFLLEINCLVPEDQPVRRRGLVWLPLLFCLWANIHIQFIYGLFALGVAALDRTLTAWRVRKTAAQACETAQTALFLWGILVASGLATLVNPYGWGVYQVIGEIALQPTPFRYVEELSTPRFTTISDWVNLAGILAAAGALTWKKRLRLWPIVMLLAGAVLWLRAGRDVWLVMTVWVCILAETIRVRSPADRFYLNAGRLAGLVVAVGLGITLLGRWPALSADWLARALPEKFPVKAADVIEAKSLRGSIYNHFDWGGYLIWRFPNGRITLDGRTNLHGEKRLDRSMNTWWARPGWQEEAELRTAGVVVAPVGWGLTEQLLTNPAWRAIYQDRTTVLFLPAEGTSFPTSTNPAGP